MLTEVPGDAFTFTLSLGESGMAVDFWGTGGGFGLFIGFVGSSSPSTTLLVTTVVVVFTVFLVVLVVLSICSSADDASWFLPLISKLSSPSLSELRFSKLEDAEKNEYLVLRNY